MVSFLICVALAAVAGLFVGIAARQMQQLREAQGEIELLRDEAYQRTVELTEARAKVKAHETSLVLLMDEYLKVEGRA